MLSAYHQSAEVTRSDKRSNGAVQRFLPLSFALVYATLLTRLPLDIFKDRANYFSYIAYSEQILARYTTGGIFSTLANEPLWLFINIALSRVFNLDAAMRVLIFIPAFLVSWQLIKRNPKHAIWMVVFLLSPQVIKNHIIHLRQGVGVSVFIVGYFAKPKWLRFALMGSACFIHSSYLFICVIGISVWALGVLRFSPRAQAAVFVLAIATVGVLIEIFAGGLTAVAGDLGARQANTYADADLDISGVGFAFWVVIFLIFVSSGEKYLRENIFACSVMAFYLIAYFLTPVSGRIFESGLFLVFTSGLALPHVRRNAFLTAFILMALGQYYVRLDQPWLGFGLW